MGEPYIPVFTNVVVKGDFINVSFMVVIPEVFYFEWSLLGCTGDARHPLIAGDMEVHKSMTAKDIWRGEKS